MTFFFIGALSCLGGGVDATGVDFCDTFGEITGGGVAVRPFFFSILGAADFFIEGAATLLVVDVSGAWRY